MYKVRSVHFISIVVLAAILVTTTFAQEQPREEWIFYGDLYEAPPDNRGPAPETLVVLWTRGNNAPSQPVPDFWESIWDRDLATPFSITRFYKKISYEASLIDAYPRAHWTGSYYYCFPVDAPTPTHQHTGWYPYCQAAIEAADPEVDFADYAVE